MNRLPNYLQIAALCLGLACTSVWANFGEVEETAPDWQTSSRKLLDQHKYDAALTQLNKANETQSAEWNNMMGYALRKQSKANLDKAEFHYKKALAIDPRHKQAMEYYGELLLMKKDVNGAKGLLAKINAICGSSCEEYKDLKEAIETYQKGQ